MRETRLAMRDSAFSRLPHAYTQTMPDELKRPDPDATKGSLEDEADEKVTRLQVPFRGFKKSDISSEIAGERVPDSLPGECGDHGEHSGTEIANKRPA